MFYFTIIFLIMLIFLLYKNSKSKSIKYILFTMASYTVALFAMMFYLSKDTYYYNTVNNLFSLPFSIWKFMMFTPLDRTIIIRILNVSSLLVLYLGILSSFSFGNMISTKISKPIKRSVIAVIILELIIYDPVVIKQLYLLLYPKYFTPNEILNIQNIIQLTTSIINLSIVLFSIIILIYVYIKASPLKLIKMSILGVGICYALIMTSYVFFFGTYPEFLVKISKVAGTQTYRSISLNTNKIVHSLFPIYLIITFLILCYCVFKISQVKSQINNTSFSLSKQISASDTTSKAFCHYIKNELLAIQAEVDMLKGDKETKNTVKDIVNRCDYLYERLDILHKSTKSSELVLKEVELTSYIKKILEHFSYELKDYNYSVKDLNTSSPYALIDPNYFEQALHNIIVNSLDAMNDLEKERKNLEIEIQEIDNWIAILVKDTGKGISEKHLKKIFSPFYSSQPLKEHWGIGLSLTHKIIYAHEGHIEIDSALGRGTVVKIMLPRLI